MITKITSLMLVMLLIPFLALSTVLYDFSVGSGTTWTGWTWYDGDPIGADDYGSAGWRDDSGQFYTPLNNWQARLHDKSDYGNRTTGEIDTIDIQPDISSGGVLRVYDLNPNGGTTGSITSGTNILTVADPSKFEVGQRITMPDVPLFYAQVNPLAEVGSIDGNDLTIVHQSSGDPLNADATVSGGAVNPVWRSSWWYLHGQSFSAGEKATSDTNRMSFYLKLESSFAESAGLDIGTYLCWEGGAVDGGDCPDEANGPSGGRFNQAGQHYYHQMYVSSGEWIHVQLDQHPEHARQASGAGEPVNDPMFAELGKHYFENMNNFYLETKDDSLTPTEYRLGSIDLWAQTNSENEESICNVWVGYWPTSGLWKIGFNDNSFNSTAYNDYSMSTFELRYSTQPITNANYANATIIAPILNKIDNENLFRRASSWQRSARTTFSLPVEVMSGNSVLYFAIKDVSVAGEHVGAWPYNYGDGHDAPTGDIKTINYALTSQTSSPSHHKISWNYVQQ